MCNIYRIYLNRKTSYDQYEGAVVVAFSEKDARETYPRKNFFIPSVEEQIKMRDNGSLRGPHIPLDIIARKSSNDIKDRGPWRVEHHYTDALGFHITFNGKVLEEEQDLFRKCALDEWTLEPDKVQTEFIGVVPKDKDYSPRVIMGSFKHG